MLVGSAQIAERKLLMALPLVGAITPQYCAKLACMLHVMDRANKCVRTNSLERGSSSSVARNLVLHGHHPVAFTLNP